MPPTGILLLIAPDPPARNLRPPNSVQWHRFRMRTRRRAAVPKTKKPVARRLVCGDFCLSRPAYSGARFGFRHLSPLKRSEPRSGRSAGRAGYSVSCAPPRKQVSPLTGFGRTPFAKASRGAGLGGPHAAGAAPRARTFKTTLERPSCGRGCEEDTRGVEGAGITFYKNFRPCQRELRLSLANDG
jgi:hypothetical protein